MWVSINNNRHPASVNSKNRTHMKSRRRHVCVACKQQMYFTDDREELKDVKDGAWSNLITFAKQYPGFSAVFAAASPSFCVLHAYSMLRADLLLASLATKKLKILKPLINFFCQFFSCRTYIIVKIYAKVWRHLTICYTYSGDTLIWITRCHTALALTTSL